MAQAAPYDATADRAASRGRAADFLSLTKPRLNSLVLVTTVAAYYLGDGHLLPWTQLFHTIVGTALGASLRAVGSLTQNSNDLRASLMATWSAENRLSQIRMAREWPPLGNRSFECPQGELTLVCQESVFATPNPAFRRVEVSVVDAASPERRIIKLTQVVPNGL